jgi:hypothetical protein
MHGAEYPVVNATRHAPSAQHASTEFKWASDRHSQQEQTTLTPSETRTSAGSSVATTLGGHSRAGSITPAATAADALPANEFKWISDYVENAEGEKPSCAAVILQACMCLLMSSTLCSRADLLLMHLPVQTRQSPADNDATQVNTTV